MTETKFLLMNSSSLSDCTSTMNLDTDLPTLAFFQVYKFICQVTCRSLNVSGDRLTCWQAPTSLVMATHLACTAFLCSSDFLYICDIGMTGVIALEQEIMLTAQPSSLLAAETVERRQFLAVGLYNGSVLFFSFDQSKAWVQRASYSATGISHSLAFIPHQDVLMVGDREGSLSFISLNKGTIFQLRSDYQIYDDLQSRHFSR